MKLAFYIKLLLLLFLIYLPAPAYAHSETQIIEMMPEGFVPTEITLDENSAVIFINKDTENHWPASDDHPTHDIYPEFDPKRAINPGQSWAFKPTKIGRWEYHDHLFPHRQGVLTVEPEENGVEVREANNDKEPLVKEVDVVDKVKTFFANIFKSYKNFFDPNENKKISQKKLLNVMDFNKLSPEEQFKELENISKLSGSQQAWSYIKDIFKGQSGSSGNIHDLAHLSGALLYEDKGFEGLSFCSVEFAFGCYHGFLDKTFKKDLSKLKDAKNACLKLGKGLSGPVASCIHGIGHGVASFYGTADLKKALSSCRILEEGSEYCFDGVFMEFVRNAPISFFNKNDALYPCNSLEEEFGYAYSTACGRNQSSLLMGRFGFSFEQVVVVCLSSSSKPFKEACFDSLGFSLASTGDVNKIISGCGYIDSEEFTLRCIRAAAGELIFQEVPGWEENSQMICSSYPTGQSECLAYIDRLISDYGRQKKLNLAPFKEGEDLNSYIREVLGVCYKNGGRDDCYKQAASVLYQQFGLVKTINLLKQNENFPEVYARCHEVTHYLSRSEYEKQKSIAKVYAKCDSTCHGGCYHGTLEAYLKEESIDKNIELAAHFPSICGKKSDYTSPLVYNECFHGLGHAAMFVTDMELKESLNLCDTLASEEPRGRCYSGVFMENSSSSTSFDHVSKYIKKDDPFYPCNILEEKYQALCWQYQSSYFSIITNQDWEKVADLCLQVPKKYQDNCFKTIGTNQVGFTQSLTTMKNNCQIMPSDNFRNICISGVISSLSYRFVGDTKKMMDFCLLVDPEFQENCYKQMGAGIRDWESDTKKVAEYCAKIPSEQGYTWCMSTI